MAPVRNMAARDLVDAAAEVTGKWQRHASTLHAAYSDEPVAELEKALATAAEGYLERLDVLGVAVGQWCDRHTATKKQRAEAPALEAYLHSVLAASRTTVKGTVRNVAAHPSESVRTPPRKPRWLDLDTTIHRINWERWAVP